MSTLSKALVRQLSLSRGGMIPIERLVCSMIVMELDENEAELTRLREAIEKHKEVTTRMDWITDADRELHDALKEPTVG